MFGHVQFVSFFCSVETRVAVKRPDWELNIPANSISDDYSVVRGSFSQIREQELKLSWAAREGAKSGFTL